LHNEYTGPYTSNVPELAALVSGLGVSLARDIVVTGNTGVCSVDRTIAATGTRFDFIVQVGRTISDVASWVSCVGSTSVSSLEGPNEYDREHPSSVSDWGATLAGEQTVIHSYAMTQQAHIGVIAPSLTSATAAETVGSLASLLTFGNVHIYFNGYNPETSGYGPHGAGPNGYGSIGYMEQLVKPISGSLPIAVTEAGYGTLVGGAGGQVSEKTQAKYLPRMLLYFASVGVSKTFLYELIDEGGHPYSNYGLVRSDYSLKPSYNAVKSMLALLHDSGSVSDTLPLAFTGQTSNLETVLFKRSDGTFILALWLKAESSDPSNGDDIAVAPQSVNVMFNRNIISPTSYIYDSSFVLQPSSVPSSNHISLSVADQVQFLTFK
jgi:hypothetical protein